MARATIRTRVTAKSSDTVLLKLPDSVVPHTVRLPDAGFRLWGRRRHITIFASSDFAGQQRAGHRRRPAKCPCAGADEAIYSARCPGLDEERGQPAAGRADATPRGHDGFDTDGFDRAGIGRNVRRT